MLKIFHTFAPYSLFGMAESKKHKITVEEREKASREVVQSYIATTAMYDFNVYEKRVLYNLVKLAQSQIEGVRIADNLCRIDHSLKGFVLIELPISYFLTDPEDKNHARIKEALKSLHQKTFTYRDEEVWECFSIIANPKIQLRSSMVSFIVNSKVWDVLLDFSRGFARYDINTAFSLESSYSMRFYELLASQSDPIIYTIESLRKIFNLENKYALTKDFIRYVVEPARNELTWKAPVTFEFTPIKEGKRITQLMFFPVRQPGKEAPDTFIKSTLRRYPSAALSRDEKRILLEIGFTESGIKNNLPLFIECQKHIDFIYELTLIKAKSRGKNNPCGWCINALVGKLADQAKKKL